MNKNIWKTVLGVCIATQSLANEDHKSNLHQLENYYAEQSLKVTPVVPAGSIATVGNDVNCDYRLGTTRIQDAIDDGNLEIRIAEGVYAENLTIDQKTVSLLGGYEDCSAADNNVYNAGSIDTQITPANGNGAPVVLITGNDQRYTVEMRNIRITNGEGSGLASGGGISTLLADLQLNLNHVWISENTGDAFGGGMAIIAGNTDVNAYNLMVYNNEANAGGGIYCSGSEASIFIDGASNNGYGIAGNRATSGNGGGALLQTECQLTSYTGASPGGFLDFRGFLANTAIGSGGGISVESGADARLWGNRFCTFIAPFACYGDLSRPNSFIGNDADSDNDNDGNGGAVFVTGAGSTVTGTNIYMSGNSGYYGGAVTVADEASAEFYASYSNGLFLGGPSPCWSNEACNQFISNLASENSGYGGAFFAESGGALEVSRSHIMHNRADIGAGVYARNENSSVIMEGNLIANNGASAADGYGDNYPVRIFDGAQLSADYLTIADNDAVGASVANNSSTINLYSSIIHESNGVNAYLDSSAVSTSMDCIIANEVGSLPVHNTIIADDPEFIDRNNGDFHIDAAFSPAVDYCDSFYAEEDFNDIDNEERGWEDYVATNHYGPFDVGYDETYQNDVIFENGFE